MRWLLTPLILAASAPAAAQTSFTGGDFDIDWSLPDDLACTRPDDGCDPMSIAECSDAATQARELEVTVSLKNGTSLNLPSTEAKIYVWLEAETSEGAECGFDDGDTEQQIGQALTVSAFTGDPLLSRPFEFPDDLSDTLTLTVAEIMTGAGDLGASFVEDACTTAVEETYRLCFGLDSGSTGTTTGGPDGKVEPTGTLNELSGWIRLVVDTVPPPDVVSAVASAHDGALVVRPRAAADTDSTDRWKVIMRRVAEGATPDGSTCLDWTGSGIIVDDDTLATQSTVTVDATNWVTYEGCVLAVDQVGNEGAPAPFSGMPVDECDFIECYPEGGLEGGYCATGEPVSLAGALALLLLRRARRKERRS